MSDIIVEPTADQPRSELVAEYKRILRDFINLRPSGTRIKIAQALDKNKSFVSQITNPGYDIPIPARHLNTIFKICRFSLKEKETFLKAYTAAHPNYHYRIQTEHTPQAGGGKLVIDLPLFKDPAKRQQVETMIRDFADQLFKLVQE